MRSLLILLLVGAACSCAPCRHLASSTADSVRIEVRTRTELVRDTVFFELPAQSERVIVRDTASRLENDYAYSEARIGHDGRLFHSLATKPRRQPVPFEKNVEHRDSIVYRDRDATTIVEVPRELTQWQKFRLWGFWVLIAVLLFVCRKGITTLVGWCV